MDIRDKGALYEIKHKFGGAITTISGANALRYKVRHKEGVINLINAVNGLIRNPTRMLQLNKLCVKYGIKFKEPLPLTFNDGWYSGFVDSDGSIYLNEKSGQVFISVSQKKKKNKYLLDPLQKLYGGKIYILSPKIDAFKYSVYPLSLSRRDLRRRGTSGGEGSPLGDRKNELFHLMDNYFLKYPLRTAKAARLALIRDFYKLRPYRILSSDTLSTGGPVGTEQFNKWVTFLDKWEKYRN
jgi:hypothetical protein